MRTIIAGGRDFNNIAVMEEALKGICDITEVVCGKAKGADQTGEFWAHKTSTRVKHFEAQWKDLTVQPCVVKSNYYGEYNALAGHNRNKAMGDYADMLIVFWDGKSKGTANMIQYIKSLHKPYIIFNYHGNIIEDMREECGECNVCSTYCDVCGTWYRNDEPCELH